MPNLFPLLHIQRVHLPSPYRHFPSFYLAFNLPLAEGREGAALEPSEYYIFPFSPVPLLYE
jgi:hypothetical protein